MNEARETLWNPVKSPRALEERDAEASPGLPSQNNCPHPSLLSLRYLPSQHLTHADTLFTWRARLPHWNINSVSITTVLTEPHRVCHPEGYLWNVCGMNGLIN